MTATTRNRPTETEAAEAVERFMAILEHRAEGRPADLASAAADLRAALDDSELVDRALGIVDQIESRLATLVHLGPGPHIAALLHGQVTSVRTLLAAATAEPVEITAEEQSAQAQLENAEQEVAEARRALDAARRDLAAAVDAGNIDQVIELRRVVEVAGPNGIDEAELALVDARLALVRAKTAGPRARIAAAVAPLEKATSALEKAEVAFERAKADHEKAESVVAVAEGDAHTLEAEIAHLTLDRTQMIGEHHIQRQERVRRLAGLATTPPTPSEPAVRPVSLITSPPVTLASH